MGILRGLTKRQEQNPSLLIRDTRTLGQRTHDYLENPRNAALIMVVAAISTIFFISVVDIILLLAIMLFIYSCRQQTTLPFRLPQRSNILDHGDPKPGGNQPNNARGICLYGNEIGSNEELWFNNIDMRTHTLFFGSTGSGKTTALISIAYNALILGSGFIYVDGKGDNSLFATIFSMARSMGREDDVLLINFMTGARDIVGPQERRLSNTLNPFCTGSSSMLSQLVISLMSEAAGTPDGDMWKGRAISFVEALMKILVYMRDQGKLLLDANSVRYYFELQYLEPIIVDKIFPLPNGEGINIANAPKVVTEPLYNYVINLPGYNKQKKGKQVSQVLEQHGFITMQLTRVFTSLADTYGHILRTNLAEVDLKDVVLNRRILIVLLPALEKSPNELANLGKIIIASLKAMMAAGLGEEVEGEYHNIILRKPTNSPTPYLCILDEYGYYAVPGFAVVPAQARSLGFSVIFAGQDLPAFQKASKEEAASIGANTNIKIAMKLEDPVETWDFFAKTAGEAYVTKVDSFQTDAKSVLNHYMDTRSASSEKRARVDLLDLKDQREGEAHIFFQSTIIRARMFFANPKPIKRMRLNQFLKIEAPETRKLVEFEEHLEKLKELIKTNKLVLPDPEFNPDIQLISEIIHTDQAPTFIERGVAALLAFHNKDEDNGATSNDDVNLTEEMSNEEALERTDGVVDLFSRVHLLDLTKELIPGSEFDKFSTPLLNKKSCERDINRTIRLIGESAHQSARIASELIRDMELATKYPPEIQNPPIIDDIIVYIKELSESLQQMKKSS